MMMKRLQQKKGGGGGGGGGRRRRRKKQEEVPPMTRLSKRQDHQHRNVPKNGFCETSTVHNAYVTVCFEENRCIT